MEKREFTAVLKKEAGWWIGWVEEIAGVNSQGKTKDELISNLESALREMLEMNRSDALNAAESDYEEAVILAWNDERSSSIYSSKVASWYAKEQTIPGGGILKRILDRPFLGIGKYKTIYVKKSARIWAYPNHKTKKAAPDVPDG